MSAPRARAGIVLAALLLWHAESPASPLHGAARDGNTFVISQEVENGADVDAPDDRGVTPLIAAILSGKPSAATALLAAGADADAETTISSSILADLGAPLPRDLRMAMTALHIAALTDSAELVRTLATRGASIDARAEDGMTALMVAAALGKAAAVRELIELGADLEAANDAGDTPLLVAVEAGNSEVARLLAKGGAALDVQNGRQQTPLRIAIERPDTELAEFLRALGAPAAVADEDGAAPLDAAIAVTGVPHAIARAAQPPPRSPGLGPMGIALAGGWVYWSEPGSDRLRRARPDGSEIETVIEAAGPVGVVAGDGWLTWTTDRHYPRKLQRARIEDRAVVDLLAGRYLNRPGPITLDADAGKLYWAESVAGRIRRADSDGTSVQDIVTSGLGVVDEAGEEVTSVHGVAVAGGFVYWSERVTATVQRARMDGSDVEVLLSPDDGLDAPAGIAIDSRTRALYWADTGAGTIRRAQLDDGMLAGGAAVDDLLTEADGLIGPYGLAVDGEAAKLYWTDPYAGLVQRANLDGTTVETIYRSDRAAEPGARTRKALGSCLELLHAIKAVKTDNADAIDAAPLCSQEMARLHPKTVPGTVFETVPGTVLEWGRLLYPMGGDLLAELRPFAAAFPSFVPGEREAALAAIDALAAAWAPVAGAAPAAEARGVASGQSISYPARRRGHAQLIVADDGYVRAGAAMRFRDNGDGTLTDMNTGLSWEKKCDCDGDLHDLHGRYRWQSAAESESIAGFLDEINTEGGSGLGGFDDWRVPSVNELTSIVDYDRFNPSAPRDFDAPRCGFGCDDPAAADCSCTAMNSYWTSTEYAQSPRTAFAVGFNLGLVGDVPKQEALPVRAVRGPTPPWLR